MRHIRILFTLAIAALAATCTVLCLPRRASAAEQPRRLPSAHSSTTRFTTTWGTVRLDEQKSFAATTDRSLALDADGRPHIAYGGDHMYYARYDGSTWRKEIVDPAWGVGLYASLDLGSGDTPHIAYVDEGLKYARREGDGWHVETVGDTESSVSGTSIAVDSDDRPHIAYLDATQGQLKHAFYDGHRWHMEEVDGYWSSGGCSLALDSGGKPHIAYSEWIATSNVKTEIRHAYLESGSWITETVAAGSLVGQDVSLALDDSDHAHISYLDGGASALEYARWDGTDWTLRPVDSGVGSAAIFSSIALDDSSDPHIAYTDATNGQLLHAHLEGDSWAVDEIDTSGWMQCASLAASSPDSLQVAYLGRSDDDLHYASWSGGDWTTQTVDRGAVLGRSASLALAPTAPYTPHVSYDGEGLRHASFDGSTWATERLSTVAVWAGTSIALSPTPPHRPRIGYYDRTNDLLHFARQTRSGWHTETVDSLTDPRFGLSLALVPTAPYTPCMAYVGDFDLRLSCATVAGWSTETIDYGGEAWYESLAHPSLALAPTYPYTPHVSYHSRVDGDVRYARLVDRGWVTESLGYAGGGTTPTALALDSSGNPHIAAGIDGLLHAYKEGGGWITDTVDSESAPTSVSLALDGDDRPHIAYYAEGSLMTAAHNGDTWELDTADSSGDVGSDASLALENDDRPRIAYYDGAGRDLKFAWVDRVDQVSADGGTVDANAAARLELPSGALTDTVALTYTALQPTASQPNVGVFLDVQAVYSDTGTQADIAPGKSFTMVVRYDQANVPQDVRESDLALHTWDGSQLAWIREPTSLVDTGSNTITATPNHLSVWAALGRHKVYLPLVLRPKAVAP